MNIVDLTPRQLRQFIRGHHENAYILIDVRQPGEYEHGHIPGARLMPLPELVRTMESVPRDKELVLYCHSGGRSMAAAAMLADEEIGDGPLYNLSGGMLAWDGAVAADYPRVQLFNRLNTPVRMLQTAMNLEKGALNFYTHVQKQYANQPWAGVFGNLAQAEIGHARTVYQFLRRIETRVEGFETLFDRLSGDVLEGGTPLETALQKASAVQGRACLGLVELALGIEYAAFDLYRAMADQAAAPDAREAFMTIAQAEKGHMHALVQAIEACPQ